MYTSHHFGDQNKLPSCYSKNNTMASKASPSSQLLLTGTLNGMFAIILVPYILLISIYTKVAVVMDVFWSRLHFSDCSLRYMWLPSIARLQSDDDAGC